MPGPQTSVVIPVRNGERSLPDLLESLSRQSAPPASFEVVVVDNASTDRTAEVAREHGARVVSEARPNRSLARNRGVEAASGAALAFIDADCVASPGWIEALTECLGRSDLVAGPVRLVTHDPATPIERLETLWRFRQEHAVRAEGWAVTANLAMTRAAFERVGGFDPGFHPGGEDVDICLRARRAGFGIAFCSGAEVQHPAETRLWPMLRRAVSVGHADERLGRVHGRPGGGHWHRLWPLLGRNPLRRFDTEPGAIEAAIRRRVLLLARIEFAGRMAGSAWGALSPGVQRRDRALERRG